MMENPQKYGSPINATFTEINWIVSIAPLGALSTCLFVGWTADKIGRKTIIVTTAIPSLICWVLSDIIPSVPVLLISRFILGIGMGIIAAIVPVYIGEIADVSIRGKLGTQFQFFLLGGEIIMFVMALFENYHVIALPGIVCSLALQLGSFFIPETPFYLVAADNSDRAAEVLRKLREPGSRNDVSDELQEMRETIKHLNEQQPSLSNILKSKANRKSIAIGVIMMVFQQLSGINGIIFYSQSIFEKQVPHISPVWITIVTGVISLIATFVSGYTVDIAGRKTLLILSGLGMAISFWILGTNIILVDSSTLSTPWISVAMVLCFMIAFAIGYGTVPWVLTGEIFSFEVKRFGNGVAVATNFIFVFVVSYGFRVMILLIGEAYTFYVFGTFSIIGVIIVTYYVPETKNRSFAEIQAILAA